MVGDSNHREGIWNLLLVVDRWQVFHLAIELDTFPKPVSLIYTRQLVYSYNGGRGWLVIMLLEKSQRCWEMCWWKLPEVGRE